MMTQTDPNPGGGTPPAGSDQTTLRFYAENVIFILLTAYFTVRKISQVLDLIERNIEQNVPNFSYLLSNLMVFVMFDLLLIIAFATRSRPKVQASRWQETLLPLVSSYFILIYNLDFVSRGPAAPLLPYYDLLFWIGFAFALSGGIFAIYAISNLRRSFAIFVDVREVVQSGPYRFIRHPLYVAEALVILGVMTWNMNALFAVLSFIHISTLVWRAHVEEAKLSAHDEGYRAYMARTGRFFPRLSSKS